ASSSTPIPVCTAVPTWAMRAPSTPSPIPCMVRGRRCGSSSHRCRPFCCGTKADRMAPHEPRLMPGVPYPLGATWDGLGTNFAVFSAHAEHLDLCLFDPSGRREIARYPMPECTDEVWHGYLPGAQAGLLYGYRARGPYDPQNGHRF